MGNNNYSYNSVNCGDKESYVGEMLNGKRNGKGVYISPLGKYTGDFLNGMMHGHGTYEFKNGDVYIGELKQDMMHGIGICKYSNGNIYNGEWKQGYYSGKGKMIYGQTGDIYEGEWQRHKKQGTGSYYFNQTGTRYNGQYKNGLRNGKGTVFYVNSKVMEAKFINGKIIYIYNIYTLDEKQGSESTEDSNYGLNRDQDLKFQEQISNMTEQEIEQSMNSFDSHNVCSICLSRIQKQSVLNTKLQCGHSFHTNCIDIWIQNSQKCPLCRSALPCFKQLKKIQQPYTLSSSVGDGDRSHNNTIVNRNNSNSSGNRPSEITIESTIRQRSNVIYQNNIQQNNQL